MAHQQSAGGFRRRGLPSVEGAGGAAFIVLSDIFISFGFLMLLLLTTAILTSSSALQQVEINDYHNDLTRRIKKTFPVTVRSIPNGNIHRITFTDDSVFFPTGDWTVKPTAAPLLDKLATLLRDEVKKRRTSSGEDKVTQIVVEGNTDADRIDQTGLQNKRGETAKDNWELSARRSLAILRQLQARNVPSELLTAVGRGEYFPFKEVNDTRPAAARQQDRKQFSLNRRIEVLVIYAQSDAYSPSLPAKKK